jgi:hypothetical protein
MRKSSEHLPALSNNASPRHSPVFYNQLRSPFDGIVPNGNIKAICHKNKFFARLDKASPDFREKSPVVLPKVLSDKMIRTKIGFFKKIRNINDKRKETQRNRTPVFFDYKEVTFGQHLN